MKNKILVKRHYLLIENQNDKNAPYFACKLLNQFGVVVDKPKKLSRENVATIAEFYGTKIPEGFYRNPQDTKFYNRASFKGFVIHWINTCDIFN